MTVQTKARSIRIPDEVWEHARLVAETNNTTVTSLILEFLKGLRTYEDPETLVERGIKRKNKQFTPRPFKVSTGTIEIGEVLTAPVDTASCPHKITKTITFGTFCRDCGQKL